ncbi:MAG: hypothetical protein E6G11_05040 [Actinobacteria bacterium]|nr:MAG: hypothetical protein E6G11_05040 [Actinomycetota bacterium]
MAAIKQAHAERQLDDRWLEWEGDSEVTAAVRLDTLQVEGRFYTFLPMAVASPFSGHLNAPFYAKLDRRDVTRSRSLNRLFLDAGARACACGAGACAAGKLRTRGGGDRPDQLARLRGNRAASSSLRGSRDTAARRAAPARRVGELSRG